MTAHVGASAELRWPPAPRDPRERELAISIEGWQGPDRYGDDPFR